MIAINNFKNPGSYPVFLITLLFNITAFGQNPQLLPGFPVYIDSFYRAGFESASAIIADFDGDGNNDIFFSLQRGTSTKIYLLNNNGQIITNWPRVIDGRTYAYTAAGDVNNDGFIDIVVRSMDSLYVIDYLNRFLTGFPVFFGDQSWQGSSVIALYDLDEDGKLEIITKRLNQLTVINYDGTTRAGWPRTVPGDPETVNISPISVGDLNNDNIPEIIASSSSCPGGFPPWPPCDSNQINIFEPNGNNFPGWPVISDSNYQFYFHRTAASIFKGSIADSSYIVINSNYYSANTDSFITRTSRYDCNGLLKNRYWTKQPFQGCGPVSLGNFNGNDNLEQSFGSQPNPVYLFTFNGQLLPGWPVQIWGNNSSSPVIGRITGNMNLFGHETRADTSGGYWPEHGYIRAFNPDGTQLAWSPLRPRGIPQASVTFGNLNNDGWADMISLCNFNYNNGTAFGTVVYAWTFPGVQFTKENFPWPMWGHDRYRTFQYGFVPPDEPIGIKPVSREVPKRFRLYQNYPNPFNPSTTIKFDIPKRSSVRLSVFDILGREVSKPVNEALPPGQYKVVWDGSSMPSGVYYYRLEANSQIMSGKMILIK